MIEDTTVPGGDYNLVPYVSKPFPQSQPARLAALAHLFALTPPDVTRASTLELGCAAGGNIIPLALRFPFARFRGIDLTERHVRDGQARVEQLGITNVSIEQGDIGALELGRERFDYIVCHGVYSWVRPAVREAILRICAAHLADDGVAYISYNVLPGWQQRGIIRDMMIYHAGVDGEPGMRIAKARWVLDNIANASRQNSPYGEMLREEARMLARMEDAYILGEFLAEENAPCYFRDFAAAAERHGLAYLCEAEIQQCIPEHIGPEIGKLIRVMSANKLVPLEQYMDFFKGRTFRQTLLVNAVAAARAERTIQPERARGIHVAGCLTCDDQSNSSSVFRSASGATLTTSHPGVRPALHGLSQAYPATRTVAELAGHGAADPALEPMILDAVFKMILIGMLEISSVPVHAEGDPGMRPTASALARLDAQCNSGWTTSVNHGMLPLDVACTALLPYLDGQHDRDALRERLLAAVRDGRVRMFDTATNSDLQDAALAAAATEHVAAALGRLARGGILN